MNTTKITSRKKRKRLLLKNNISDANKPALKAGFLNLRKI
jgi:hypothetical protein